MGLNDALSILFRTEAKDEMKFLNKVLPLLKPLKFQFISGLSKTQEVVKNEIDVINYIKRYKKSRVRPCEIYLDCTLSSLLVGIIIACDKDTEWEISIRCKDSVWINTKKENKKIINEIISSLHKKDMMFIDVGTEYKEMVNGIDRNGFIIK